MNLIKCHIENFGRLSNVDFDFNKGVNSILEENGWGKTTLAAFIRCMFYGLAGSRKKEYIENERAQYQPWNDGFFGGEITFEVDGKTYIIRRNFGKKDKDATFQLVNASTGLDSSDYSENIGEELFGVDRASFMRTSFVDHTSLRYEGISSAISAKVSSVSQRGDLENYDRSADKLTAYLNENSPTRKSGKLAKINESIKQLEYDLSVEEDTSKRIQELRDKREVEEKKLKSFEAASRSIGEYNTLKSNAEGMKRSIDSMPVSGNDRLEELSKLFANGVPAESEVQEHIGLNNEVQNLVQKNSSLDKLIIDETRIVEAEKTRIQESQIENDRKAKNKKLAGIGMLAAGIVLALAVLLLSGAFKILIPVLGAVLIIAGILVCVTAGKSSAPVGNMDESRLNNIKNERQANEAEIAKNQQQVAAFLSRFGMEYGKDAESNLYSIKSKAEEYEGLKKGKADYDSKIAEMKAAYNEALLKLNEYVGAHPELAGNGTSHDEITAGISETQANIAAYDRQLDEAMEKLDEQEEKKETLAAMKEEMAELKAHYDVVKKTSDYLREAKERFVARFMSPIMTSFEKYHKIMVGTDAKDFIIDANMDISKKEEGEYHDIEAQSDGLADMLGLCIRVALLDTMYTKEKPFIVMDDPFSNMDEAKINGGKRFLDEISKEYQVIYLTCHKSRM